MGMNCYKEGNVYTSSSDSKCSHNSYCELYRHNSSYYEARCEEHCIHHECPKDGTPMDGCSIYCCNTSKCLTLDNVLGSMNDTTVWQSTAPATTITQATTIATVVYSDKICRSFRCDGADCYKNHANGATKKCQVGINHCELQKKVTGTTVSYEGGCSNTCATSTKSCSSITNSDCFHECCNATTTACCMKLDGQVHFNTAAHINLSSFLKIFSYAFIVIFSSCFFSSQWA
ncbi:uncharacterized protein LOC128472652 [Spea bombifrons]|uniref:uncharacterized protein LOC128472652 n=1 Tax=Spea bombifrons TaxID=233779 RepID=UPI00234AAD19|nr:uncharacterized protein LOC128472652 [Spea bombifrons]